MTNLNLPKVCSVQPALTRTFHSLLMKHSRGTLQLSFDVFYLNTIKNSSVQLAFINGKKICPENIPLDFKDIKLVEGIDLYHIGCIENARVSALLQKAFIIQETLSKKVK